MPLAQGVIDRLWAQGVRGDEQVGADDLNEDARRARELILARVDAMRTNMPSRIHICGSLEDMAKQVAEAYKRGEVRKDLLPVILISGTSGESQEPKYQVKLKEIIGNDAYGLWQRRWDESREAQTRESALKERAAVKVHVITNDTASFGSLAEAYASAVEAFQNGQQMVIVLEDGWGDKKEEDGTPWRFGIQRDRFKSEGDYMQAIKDARNARTALVEHLGRYKVENPDGIKFILSNDLDEDLKSVAEFAKKSLDEMRAA